MQALEPVLKQKFWILLGMGILMTFIGWWMATGTIAQAITERKTKIEAAESSIPKGDIPNDNWTKRLSEVNDKQDSSIKTTQLGLWKRQLDRMELPQGLAKVDYQGTFQSADRELFRDAYPNEVRRVWKMLNPMDFDGTGVVKFPIINMFKVMNQKQWIVTAPKSEIIWQVMEDLWLLEGLFQSIAEVNGGPQATRADAAIHQIDKLELRGGGDKNAMASSGGVGGGGGGGITDTGMGLGMGLGGPPRGFPGGDLPGGPGATSSLPAISAEFDPKEEFGDDGSTSGASFGGGGGGGGLGMGAMGMGGGGGNDAATETVVKRYVSNEERLPYKTRGFYLSVKMDHRRIPQFLAELTANDKSVWPVEILRVQMSRLHEDDSPSSLSSSSSSVGADYASRMPPGQLPMGLGGPLSGSANGDDGISGFTESLSGPAAGSAANLLQQKAAQELLDIALKDPYMAQVTVCGVFTMYRKVELPKVEPVVETKPATPVVPEATEETPNLDGQGAAPGDEKTASEPEPQAAVEPETEPVMEGKEPAGAEPAGAEPASEFGERPEAPPAKANNENEQK